MKSTKKKLFTFLLFFFLIVGSINSLKTGISFDENYEELNWNFNVNVTKDFLNSIISNKDFNYENFNSKVKNFVGYGIGFQIISQPIQNLIDGFVLTNFDIDSYGAKLISKHLVVFIFFFISGLFFYLILRKFNDNENFTILGTIVYLTYPYLFGQSMFSPKDIPFMSVWLVCTFIKFNLVEKLIKNKEITNIKILIFSFLTAYLLSIRIGGLLIFIQYSITLILYLYFFKEKLNIFVKKFYRKCLLFLFAFTIFTFVLNPTFLIDPFLFFETLKINLNHFNNVGTLTMGSTMYSKNLPSTYLLIWLMVKIPLICLFGLMTIPFVDKKIFNNKKNSIFFSSIILSIFSIIFILIYRKVHLYDEIRQVMFLIPLIFIVSLFSLYKLSKKFFFTISILSISFFIIENIKINPYQYVWFNMPSRYFDLSKNFELEYQGISGREIAKHLKKIDDKNLCILVNPIHSVKPFLKNTKFNCFDIWQKIDTNYERPFLAVQNVRNLKKSLPYGCREIYETNFKLFFQEKKIITAKLLECF